MSTNSLELATKQISGARYEFPGYIEVERDGITFRFGGQNNAIECSYTETATMHLSKQSTKDGYAIPDDSPVDLIVSFVKCLIGDHKRTLSDARWRDKWFYQVMKEELTFSGTSWRDGTAVIHLNGRFFGFEIHLNARERQVLIKLPSGTIFEHPQDLEFIESLVPTI